MYVKLITIILLINLLKTLAALSVDKNQSEYYYMQEGEVTSLARWKFLATICQGILAICSGTVISEYWVLSATSCFEEKYKNISQQFYLRTGVAVGITEQIIQYVPDVIKNLSHTQITDATLFYGTVPEEKIIPIARIILHESFLSKYADIEINQNDIALIKVVRKLTGNGVDAMSAAKTPPIRYANCRTVGWAPTVDDPGIYGLHEIDLTLLPSQSGLKTLVFLNEIKVRNLLHNKLMTESRTGMKRSGSSDMGAPLICKNGFQGIASSIIKIQKYGTFVRYRSESFPMFTRIDRYWSWIKHVLKNNGEGKFKGKSLINKWINIRV